MMGNDTQSVLFFAFSATGIHIPIRTVQINKKRFPKHSISLCLSENKTETQSSLSRRLLLRSISSMLLSLLTFRSMQPVNASTDGSLIGDIPTSGVFFKDALKVTAVSDPKVQGVRIYLADFERPLTERMAKNFFAEPTSASISCVKTGPITIAENIEKSKSGEEIFTQSKNILSKYVKIRRIVDEETQSLVYVTYSTRMSKEDDENKSRFRADMCSISIGN